MALPSNLAQITASDIYIGPLMTNALLCLCEAANAAPNPPAHCSFRIGTDAPHDVGLDADFCCEGLAYVSLGNVFPSSEFFPEEDINRQARSQCAPVSWGVRLRLSLVRCAPVGEGMTVISNPAWEEAALQNIYDTRTLMKAGCCLRSYVVASEGAFLGMSSVIGQVFQGNPLGGCVERFIDMTIQMPNCDC